MADERLSLDLLVVYYVSKSRSKDCDITVYHMDCIFQSDIIVHRRGRHRAWAQAQVLQHHHQTRHQIQRQNLTRRHHSRRRRRRRHPGVLMQGDCRDALVVVAVARGSDNKSNKGNTRH